MTLMEKSVAVNESYGVCCAIANVVARERSRSLASASVGSAGMPVWVGVVDAAEPLAALGTATLGGRVAGVIAVGNSFAGSLFGFFCRLFHRNLKCKRRSGRCPHDNAVVAAKAFQFCPAA